LSSTFLTKRDTKTLTKSLSVGPHEAFYTRVTCEKCRLAQKLDVVSGIVLCLTCWARSAASSCVFDL